MQSNLKYSNYFQIKTFWSLSDVFESVWIGTYKRHNRDDFVKHYSIYIKKL